MSTVAMRHTGMGATPIDSAANPNGVIDALAEGNDSAQITAQSGIAPEPEADKPKTANPLILVAIVGAFILWMRSR